ncbi:tRNA lysidine(34) synthetase TilS [Parasphingopyxis sp.]|uniref:tRNA lysidine(34) synthetase TilS n=1 Tax=Parasphingopyxis sp. TaxID=1920299 RepID=UPI002603B2F8|nr:tRNA lysidine(34) synthetase TilS [Parasphingopyxis sp.]
MSDTPLIDRFYAETERLTSKAPTADARLGIAVSGGPDSLALLSLAAQAYPGAIQAATVDHGLRPEAADEARHVTAICTTLAVPHTILTPAEPISGNLQSAARVARYALLEDWRNRERLRWIATAHHADDQIETVLMRLMRGSGVDGLSAIRPINGSIIRPLLSFTKADLVAHIAQAGIAAVSDPSNSDDTFDRVRLRKALADLPDFDPSRIARTVDALRESSEALQWLTDQEADRSIEHNDGSVALRHTDYPRELLRRLVIRCLDTVDPDHGARGPALDRAIAALSDGKKTVIGKILCAPESPGIWRFSMAPPRKTG